MIRVVAAGTVLVFSAACGKESPKPEVVDPQAERAAAMQQAKEEYEQEQRRLQRITFQEWVDHVQGAWVPVAAVAELALAWPKGARAARVTVSNRDMTIEATTTSGANVLNASLEGLQWVDGATVSDRLVTAQVTAVKRSLAPENDADLFAEIDRLESTGQYGSTLTVSDKNGSHLIDSATDAFNCWRRVEGKTERVQTMDGTWSEVPVRPKNTKVSMGQWTDLLETEVGRAWTRNRASVELRGPFPELVHGLDCMRSTSVLYSVRSIDIVPDPAASGNAVLSLVIDLPLRSAIDPRRETPWAKADSWGEAEPPGRVRTLKDQPLANPFAK